MAVEIEAKMQVDRPEVIEAILKRRGADFIGEFFEVNGFFDTADRRLLASDQGLRLRVSRKAGHDAETCVITHKGPQSHGPLKSREETELEVGSAENAARLLGHLGFRPTLSFEKRRRSWSLDGCRIEIDQVPLLGSFIEIEGPDEPSVMRVREALALGDKPLIKASYVAMLASHLQDCGDTRTHVGFAPDDARS